LTAETDTAKPRLRLLDPLTLGTGLWLDHFVAFLLPNLIALGLGGLFIWLLVDFESALRDVMLGQYPSVGFWGSLAGAAALMLLVAVIAQGITSVATRRAHAPTDAPTYKQVLTRLPQALAVSLTLSVVGGAWCWLMLQALSEASMPAFLAACGIPLLLLVAVTWTLGAALFLGPPSIPAALRSGWRATARHRLPVLVSVTTLSAAHTLWSYSSVRVLANTWPLEDWRLATLLTSTLVETAVVASFVTVASTLLYLRHQQSEASSR